MNEIMENFDKIHTTEMGTVRIRKNLELEINDVVNWCKNNIKKSDNIIGKGKNWYVHIENIIIQ